MTHVELLEDTRQYYENNPRAVRYRSDGFPICEYKTAEGNKCAVGKELDEDNPNYQKIVTDYNGTACADLFHDYGFTILKERSQKIEKAFWKMLQLFHDREANWVKTERGHQLTDIGVCEYNALKVWAEEYDETHKKNIARANEKLEADHKG